MYPGTGSKGKKPPKPVPAYEEPEWLLTSQAFSSNVFSNFTKTPTGKAPTKPSIIPAFSNWR